MARILGPVNLLILLCTVALGGSGAPRFAVLQKIPIGGEGGWDDLTLLPEAHQLFVTRGNRVTVLDLQSGKAVGEIPDTPGVHGVAIAPKAGKGYVSCGRDNTVLVFDLKSRKALKRVAVGARPDAICFDPASNRVFTFN